MLLHKAILMFANIYITYCFVIELLPQVIHTLDWA